MDMNQVAWSQKNLVDNNNLCPSHTVLSYDIVLPIGSTNEKNISMFDVIIILCQLTDMICFSVLTTIFVLTTHRTRFLSFIY